MRVRKVNTVPPGHFRASKLRLTRFEGLLSLEQRTRPQENLLRGVVFLYPPARRLCFVKEKFQPANWNGLKGRVFRGRVAISAPGYLSFRSTAGRLTRVNETRFPSAAFQRVCISRLCGTTASANGVF